MKTFLIATLLGTSAMPAYAQQSLVASSGAQDPQRDDAGGSDYGDGQDEPDIVVQGQRPRGSVIGDIKPEQQLSPADIRSFGVSSVGDLLNELAPQTRSGRGSGGAPVVLLNGKRISGFREVRDLPTEAIERVDILPEEVALKYGYRADQRVVNFVLRPRFRAVTTEIDTRLATQGGIAAPEGEFTLLRINRKGRINLHAEYQQQESVTEADRNIRFAPSLFDTRGNVVAATGTEIDPLLSARTGSIVSVTGVPASAATGAASLDAFAANANRPNVTDPTPYRTLSPATNAFTANGSYATTIFGNVNATFNVEATTASRRSRFGLAGVALNVPAGNPFSPFSRDVVVDRSLGDPFLPLSQRANSVTGHFGTTLNGTLGKWQWTLTGSYDRAENETFTDAGADARAFQARVTANDPTANPFGPLSPAAIGFLPVNQAYSTSNNGSIDALFTGSVFRLPAGDVSTSVHIGGDFTDFSSRSIRASVLQTSQVTRNIANGQVNIDVPITSRSKDFLGAIGNLSANFNLAYDHLSDFGTLRTLGYGLNWSPIDAIRLIASVTEQDEAPTPQRLGNPVISTANSVVFDYVRGENALVTVISGGNPGLARDNRLVKKLGLTLKPIDKTDLTFTANYVEARVNNPVASFPSATAEIEAAFPDRFTRDASGRLTRIDQRSINYAQTSRSELRIGFNFSHPLKSKVQKQIEAFRAGTGPNPFEGLFPGRRGGEGGGQGNGGPAGGQGRGDGARRPGGGGGGFGGGRGGFGGRGGGAGGGRLQFALYDTIHFTDRVRVGAGGPTLDLLNGDTIGNRGGQPRHELEAQAGYSNNGIGLRFSANWQSGTQVVGGTPTVPQTLNFSPLATANVRLFADFSQRLDLIRKHRWLRGVRVVVAVDNLFNERQRVTDQTGTVPISYQAGYLDPLGRSVRISLRKLFF